jgi:hypothetical protein
MAARHDSKHAKVVRERIQTSQLVTRLQNNALADEEIMTSGQIRSAEILLRKAVPDLQSTEIETGDGGLVVNLVSQVSGNKPADS